MEICVNDTKTQKKQNKQRSSNRQLGAEKEALAAEYLQEQGYRLLTRNFACRQGELDLIACKDGYLVFIEVKFRKNNRYGRAEEAVTAKKQERMQRAALYYLYKERLPQDTPCRFDVVAINQDSIEIIENAF